MVKGKIEMPQSEELFVNAIGVIVDVAPRGNRSVEKGGTPYTGVLQRDVTSAFYAYMEAKKHPLAAKVNHKLASGDFACSYKNPCGNCRRDFFQVCADEAVRLGKVVRVERSKLVDSRNGKGKVDYGWVTFYRPGELKGNQNQQKTLELLMAKLGV